MQSQESDKTPRPMRIQIGRIEQLFVLCALLALVFYFAGIGNIWTTLVDLAAFVLGFWVTIRLTRWVSRNALWRLRNRLVVAYLFVGLVPTVLICLLTGITVYLISGQIAVYLVTTELDRRTAAVRGSAEYLLRSVDQPVDFNRMVAPYMKARYPGLEVVAENNDSYWTYPEDSQLEPPPDGWQNTTGLVLRDSKLYGWAHVVNGSRAVTIIFPVTRDALGDFAAGVAESTVVRRSNALQGRTTSLLHPSLPSRTEGPQNRVPPAVNTLDVEVTWGVPIPVADWDSPGRMDTAVLMTRTRPSAVLRTVFLEKANYAADEVVWAGFLTVAALFLIAEATSLLIGISITRQITGAVHDLYLGTVKVTEGDFTHRIPTHGKDQLATLAGSFNQMTENLSRLINSEKERQRLHSELEIAREVQNQLYPKQVPESNSLLVRAYCDPARMVSGDYYDYLRLGPNRIAVAIGDVAGKGISAALLMATVQSAYRSQLRAVEDGTIYTADVVSHVNQQLYAFTSPEKYATFFCGVYEEDSGRFTYTNAGHLPAIFVQVGEAESTPGGTVQMAAVGTAVETTRQTTVSRLDVNGMVVGAFPFSEYDSSHITLNSGDTLVFFTDGITEPENAYGEMFGEDRLIDLVVKNLHMDDGALTDTITNAVRQWTGTDELQDDMTLLLIRRR